MPFLQLRMLSPERVRQEERDREFITVFATFLFGIFLIMGVLQIFIFIATTEHRATLYLGLFLVAQSMTHIKDLIYKSNWITKIIGFNKVALSYDFVEIVFTVVLTLSAFFN